MFKSRRTRRALLRSQIFYVNPNGSDDNQGDSPVNAWSTLQYAIDYCANLDSAKYGIDIVLADGSYSGAVLKDYVGEGDITIRGEFSTSKGTVLITSPISGVNVSNRYLIKWLRIVSSTQAGLDLDDSTVELNEVEFEINSTSDPGSCIRLSNHAYFSSTTGFSVRWTAGTPSSWIRISRGSQAYFAPSCNIDVPSSTAFAWVKGGMWIESGGVATTFGLTKSSDESTGAQWYVLPGGILLKNNSTQLLGNATGITIFPGFVGDEGIQGIGLAASLIFASTRGTFTANPFITTAPNIVFQSTNGTATTAEALVRKLTLYGLLNTTPNPTISIKSNINPITSNFQIVNTGSSDVSIANIYDFGSEASKVTLAFTPTLTFPYTLAPNNTIDVAVTYTDSDAAPATALGTILIINNGVTGNLTVNIDAAKQTIAEAIPQGNLVVNPTSFNIAAYTTGLASTAGLSYALEISLANNSALPVTITDLNWVGYVVETALNGKGQFITGTSTLPSVPVTLQPGTDQQITVTCNVPYASLTDGTSGSGVDKIVGQPATLVIGTASGVIKTLLINRVVGG